MKKIYLTPQTEVVKVNVEQVMQAASSFKLTSDEASVDGDDYETLSRGGGGWFDDEE